MKTFSLMFDNPDPGSVPVYSTGDEVSGKVLLEVSRPMKVQSIKLHTEGIAKVHWTESRSAGSSTAYTQNYSDEVEYYNERVNLMEAGQQTHRVQGSFCREGLGGDVLHACEGGERETLHMQSPYMHATRRGASGEGGRKGERGAVLKVNAL